MRATPAPPHSKSSLLDRDGKPAAMKGLNWELSRLETALPMV